MGTVGVWRWRIGTESLEWTANLEDVHRMAPGSFDNTLDSFRRDLDPDDAERVWQAITRCLETGEPYSVVYRTSGSSNAQRLWIEARGGVVAGEDGHRYLTGVCQDVTARVTSEAELARRLKQQELLQQLSTFALGSVPLADILDCAVQSAARIFDVPLAKVLQFVDSADQLKLVSGVGWKPGLVGEAYVGTDRDSQAGYTLLSSGPVIVEDLSTEARFSGPPLLKDHGVRSGMSVIIPGSSDRPFGVLGIHARHLRAFDRSDINAMISIANIVAQSARQHEVGERQRLLLREMAHRSGNLLQIAASLASQTFRSHADPQVALRSFASRLDSLSRANHLITRGGWGPTRISSLVDEVLGAYRDRLQIQGRDVLLPAELAFDLALVLHELAMNSLKYGSLSNADGSIELSWHIKTSADMRSFAMDWSDGQPVSTQARGTGFGTTLTRALVEKKWKGTISATSEGPYRFSCHIPLSEAGQSQDQTGDGSESLAIDVPPIEKVGSLA
jgi:two-component sensor histidine kinase